MWQDESIRIMTSSEDAVLSSEKKLGTVDKSVVMNGFAGDGWWALCGENYDKMSTESVVILGEKMMRISTLFRVLAEDEYADEDLSEFVNFLTHGGWLDKIITKVSGVVRNAQLKVIQGKSTQYTELVCEQSGELEAGLARVKDLLRSGKMKERVESTYLRRFKDYDISWNFSDYDLVVESCVAIDQGMYDRLGRVVEGNRPEAEGLLQKLGMFTYIDYQEDGTSAYYLVRGYYVRKQSKLDLE